jgi:8-oxo-dGTP pyrophosphatase MutT (NUDIX family)
MKNQAMIDALDAHDCFDALEEKHRRAIRDFVETRPDCWWKRSTAEGHVTASAWVLNAARTHALLLHHAKLDRWLQPGGHIDDDDASPAAAAWREAHEETGLSSLALAGSALFDVDVHPIPAKGAEAAHLHYDVRFCFVATHEAVALSKESLGFRWIELSTLCGEDIESSLSRMALKSHRFLI